METMHSTVKWFDAKKGYGFIDHPKGGDDVFVHYSQIESEADFKTLRTGQDVTFELKDGPKGLHATTVVPADEDEAAQEEAQTDDRSRTDTAPHDAPAHAAQPSEHRPSHTLSSPYAEAASAVEDASRQEADAQDPSGASPRAEESAADEPRTSFR